MIKSNVFKILTTAVLSFSLISCGGNDEKIEEKPKSEYIKFCERLNARLNDYERNLILTNKSKTFLLNSEILFNNVKNVPVYLGTNEYAFNEEEKCSIQEAINEVNNQITFFKFNLHSYGFYKPTYSINNIIIKNIKMDSETATTIKLGENVYYYDKKNGFEGLGLNSSISLYTTDIQNGIESGIYPNPNNKTYNSLLKSVLKHELGHCFGLNDLYCPKPNWRYYQGKTIMSDINYYDTVSKSYKMIKDFTSLDIQVLNKIYNYHED